MAKTRAPGRKAATGTNGRETEILGGADAGDAAVTKIYIAGPMSGIADLNFPAFHAEAARLRALGYTVANPAEINQDPATSWHECMRRDIAELVTCEAIRLLPGWEDSSGARLEEHIAMRLAMRVILPHQDVEPLL